MDWSTEEAEINSIFVVSVNAHEQNGADAQYLTKIW